MPVAPSAIAIQSSQVFTPEGQKPYEVPRELTHQEIIKTIQDYGSAAKNAMTAGFDGVELHAAFGYLPNEFLSESSNKRTDEYGGSIENRSRFILDVMKELVREVGDFRAGIKLSPASVYTDVIDSDPTKAFRYLLRELNKMKLAYVHLMRPMFPTPEQYPKDVLQTFRHDTKHPIIINAGYTKDSAEAVVAANEAALVSFGALYLANPDLPERFEKGAELNKPDRDTMYSNQGEKGYTDYSTLAEEK